MDESAHAFADQTFVRTTGAPLVPGNAVRILKDGKENYPAWLEAIAAATRTIHFESYIIHGDRIGLEFAEALAERARAGVRVRVLCDWFGSLNLNTHRVWPVLARAGVEARSFNPPRFDSPFGWISRDHRKVVTIDGRLAFVSGLCVGRDWVGDPARHVEPWRDTGIAVEGPAAADIDRAFADTWAIAGPPIPTGELPDGASIAAVGDVLMRVVASTPTTGELYRLDQLIAAGARRSLWLTDAYFVGTTLYLQALKSAALGGVDVRLLVPGAADVLFVRSLSRAGYRPLLEAGVRVFEWNGSMLHAKTAVADSRWARVGSTNLNLTSWIGNWELDVAVQHEGFAAAMEQMYLEDLSQATEVVLTARRNVRLSTHTEPRRRRVAGARRARNRQCSRRGHDEPPRARSGGGAGHGERGRDAAGCDGSHREVAQGARHPRGSVAGLGGALPSGQSCEAEHPRQALILVGSSCELPRTTSRPDKHESL
jgi:cardiolipin synthase A/B